MKQIPLTRGFVALVDDADFDELSQFKWSTVVGTHTQYAQRNVMIDGKHKWISMHRFIMKTDCEVDHADGHGLNNQRHNLRKCTHQQNIANGRHRKNNTSGYKGVYFCKERSTYQSYITSHRRHIYIGGFGDPIEAARAYDSKARELFGEFAKTNFET